MKANPFLRLVAMMVSDVVWSSDSCTLMHENSKVTKNCRLSPIFTYISPHFIYLSFLKVQQSVAKGMSPNFLSHFLANVLLV